MTIHAIAIEGFFKNAISNKSPYAGQSFSSNCRFFHNGVECLIHVQMMMVYSWGNSRGMQVNGIQSRNASQWCTVEECKSMVYSWGMQVNGIQSRNANQWFTVEENRSMVQYSRGMQNNSIQWWNASQYYTVNGIQSRNASQHYTIEECKSMEYSPGMQVNIIQSRNASQWNTVMECKSTLYRYECKWRNASRQFLLRWHSHSFLKCVAMHSHSTNQAWRSQKVSGRSAIYYLQRLLSYMRKHPITEESWMPVSKRKSVLKFLWLLDILYRERENISPRRRYMKCLP